MKKWRVILVLLGVIALLGTILAVKIMKNTPEKQLQEIHSNYEETVDKTSNTLNKNNTGWLFSVESEEEYKKDEQSWLGEFLSTPLGLLLGIALIILMYIGNIQIYIKLFVSPTLIGINTKSIITYILSTLLSMVPLLGIISVIMPFIALASLITFLVTSVMLEYKLFHAIDTSFWFILLSFIPYVGTIALNIIIGIRLANKFEKGLVFKIGLCTLPGVFRAILGVTA